jgi:hypothetical protein
MTTSTLFPGHGNDLFERVRLVLGTVLVVKGGTEVPIAGV